MPLDVARLRDSDLAANETPEACWAAVLLWAASWHQVPAASIPNDDRWIAKQAGYAQRGKIAKEWVDIRPGALRGWIECSDGRLYHPVVSEKAREAWQAKLEQRYRSECARIKKHNERHEGANVYKPTFEEWMSSGCPLGQPLFVPSDKKHSPQDNPGDNGSKGQGEGQGQGNLSGTDVPGGEPPDQKPPPDPVKQEIWDAGRSLLLAARMPAKQVGTFLGKLVQDYTALPVLDAVRAAVKEQPADPAEYLKACCLRSAGKRKPAEPEWRAEQRQRTQQAAPGVAVGNQPAAEFFIDVEAKNVTSDTVDRQDLRQADPDLRPAIPAALGRH